MKTLTSLLPGLLLAACAIQACKSDTTPAAVQAPVANKEMPAAPKPEMYLYLVTVDKLNLREAPNKNGKVITQFAEGEFVEGKGEVSENKEEITLREVFYNEPYIKVISTTPEQHTGWAYGGALTAVYAGPRHIAPDLGRLSQLSAFLKTLNVEKIESGKKAIDYVHTNFANAAGTLADAAFIMLQNFLFRMEIEGDYYAQTERIAWTEDDYRNVWQERFDMNKYPLTKVLAANGFRLEEGEGMIFPVVDWAKLSAFFADKVTTPMKAYILQEVAEQKDNAFDDGGLVIGLDTLTERAVFWENFNKQNPYFVRSYETTESEHWLRIVLLNGADNTPAYDYETLAITEEFRKNWAMILQKYPGTKLAKTVKEMSDLCAAEGWKRTEKVEKLQQKIAE